MDKNSAHLVSAHIPPLRIATWNVDNLGDAIESTMQQRDERIHRLTQAIGHDLHAPHILALQEICGDKKYETGQRALATENMQRLIEAIQLATGYVYAYIEIPPLNNQDGGVPNTNIRNGYLYRTDRVALTAPTTMQNDGMPKVAIDSAESIRLHANPALIDPTNPVFEGFRKPLVAQFTDKQTGEQYYLTNLHLPSNGRIRTTNENSDAPQAWQPDPLRMKTRNEQTMLIRDFQQELLTAINAKGLAQTHHVVCLGDFNTASRVVINGVEEPPASTEVLEIIGQSGLINVADERLKHAYSVGDASKNLTLDHVYVSPALRERITTAERPMYTQLPKKGYLSDHNPTVFSFAALEKAQALANSAER